MVMTENEIKETRGTVEKVRRWHHALKRLHRAKSEVNASEVEVANAGNDLGAWLVPDDVKLSEEFNVWIGDGILTARRNIAPGSTMADYVVKWRKEPSAKAACEMALS